MRAEDQHTDRAIFIPYLNQKDRKGVHSRNGHDGDFDDLDTGQKQVLANLNNAVRIMETDPQFCVVWFDDFLQRILTGDPAREWTDADDIHLTLRFQREKGIPKMSRETVNQAVTEIAFRHRRNCIKDYLESLRWDGVCRIHQFFPDYYGTDSTAYTQAAGSNFLKSMVARIYQPGCQVDTMPVIEGPQGILKSSSLRVLAGEHHSEQHETVTSKDFFQNLQGKWLIEISEMDAFSRAETSRVKQVISCTTDHFRPSYGRRASDHPRMCVFAGTTNSDDWNRDATGARRFWPIRCTEIDLDGLRLHRNQLFAEAVRRYKAGEAWWLMPAEETAHEQRERYDADVWLGSIETYIRTKSEVTVYEIMTDCLKLQNAQMHKSDQMRVAACLRVLGWKRRNKRQGKEIVKVWEV